MNNKTLPNKTLINKLKNGEAFAFTYLVDKFHQKLYVYADSLINDSIISEDIVQNVFIKVWERRSHLKEEFSIQSYLYKLVYNEFIDHYRKHKHVIPLEKKHIDTLLFITSDDNSSYIEQLNEMVKVEIQQLPSKCKNIFLLSKKNGLTNNEISELLGISIKTVEYHITKSFYIIRKNLDLKMRCILFLISHIAFNY